MRLASLSLNSSLEIKAHSLRGGQTVCLRLNRITAQKLAQSLLEYCGVRRRSGIFDNRITFAADDLTPLSAEERTAARRQTPVRLKKCKVVRP